MAAGSGNVVPESMNTQQQVFYTQVPSTNGGLPMFAPVQPGTSKPEVQPRVGAREAIMQRVANTHPRSDQSPVIHFIDKLFPNADSLQLPAGQDVMVSKDHDDNATRSLDADAAGKHRPTDQKTNTPSSLIHNPVPDPVVGPPQKETDMVPSIIMIACTIQGITSWVPMIALGSSCTLLKRSKLPPLAKPRSCAVGKADTLAGSFICNEDVVLEGITMPEFTKSRQVQRQSAYVFDGPCAYDIILGRDFLKKTQMDIFLSTSEVKWLEFKVPMKPRNHWTQESIMEVMLPEANQDPGEIFATGFKEAKYETTTPAEVVDQ